MSKKGGLSPTKLLLGLGLWLWPSSRLVTHHLVDADAQDHQFSIVPELTLSYRPLSQKEALQNEAQLRPPCHAPFQDDDMHRWVQVVMPNREATSINLGARLRPYFGTLHSHTADSDGRGGIEEAYLFARDFSRLDFFSVTDHSEYWFLNKDQHYDQQKKIADAVARPDFVTLYGFEYSNLIFGHYTVLNASKVHHAFEDLSLSDFYHWLRQPEQASALVMFAHPGFHDYRFDTEFSHFSFDPALYSRFVGIEVIHWGEYLRYFRGYLGTLPYIDEATRLGWWLGAVGSQDVHYADWGNHDGTRLAVLMPELTRQRLIEALMARHFYATNNRHLHFAVNLQKKDQSWAMMGDRVSRKELPPDVVLVKARYYDDDCREQPFRMEAVLDGNVIATYDFAQSNSQQGFPFAAEFTLQLPLNFRPMTRQVGLYFRFYQGKAHEIFTESSPIIFQG